MKIANRTIAPNGPPYVIAELGVNHDGSLDHSMMLVDRAHDAGADAIKLQFFEAERLLSREALLASYQKDAGAHDPLTMLQQLELPADQMARVVQHARSLGLHAIITVFSVELIAAAERLNPDAYKSASPDIINRPLLEGLMRTDRPLLVSTGAATLKEVEQATQWLGDHPHIMLQCVSAYPTAEEHASLAGREAMQRINPNALGYSDHTCAVDTGGLAVAAGACVLEKHLTYDGNAVGPDHAASLDPEQFAAYVSHAHRAWRMRGPLEKQLLEIERDVRCVSRQSITTTRSLPEGHVLTRDDLTIKRPSTGLSPSRLESVIGRRLQRAVEANMPLLAEDLS